MKKNKIITPSDCYDNDVNTIDGITPIKVFLGGTIDNGDSLNWQKSLIDELNGRDTVHPIIIYNPRRENWSEGAGSAEILKQANWELNHLNKANLIIMNILCNSKSPISLMEIGLFSRSNKLIVFCNPNFYRYNNVKAVCEAYDVPLYDTNDILVIKNEILKRANVDINVNYS